MNTHRIRRDKLLHMGMVAEYMRVRSEDYGLDQDEAYLVGLIHDFGYIHGNRDHGKRGSKVLYALGLPFPDCLAVRLHGVSPYRVVNVPLEYGPFTEDEIGQLRAQPAVAYEDISIHVRGNPMLTLLLEADMRVDKNGELVGFRKRQEDLRLRYRSDDVIRNAEETIRYIFEFCEKNGVAKPPTVAEMKRRIYETPQNTKEQEGGIIDAL